MSNISALKGINIALLLVALAGTNAASARPEGSTSTSGAQIDAELDQVLTRVAKESLSRVRLLDGQSRSRNVTVSANIPGKFIVVHLDNSFVPADYGPQFEDQQSLINNALLHVAEQASPFHEVKYLYGGRDIYHYFPEIKAEDDAAREEGERRWREKESRNACTDDSSGFAFVAAGHGYYYNFKDKAWVTQREEHNGVLEGMLMPAYADELKDQIESRSKMPVIRPRVQEHGIPHFPSGREWWQMAARYAIASQYPGNPEIWNTYANSTAPDREYKEDINSRPLLANHQRADVAIHLHSNADDKLLARGSRVIVQPGRPLDAELGRSVLCSMKEQIQSVAGYESFTVAREPHPLNKGENRLASMPSIIVETAFHTHPDDARALLDSAFQEASMRGVEKGYRLFREGKDCSPFTLQQIPDVETNSWSYSDVELNFVGHPRFPLYAEFSVAQCGTEGACSPWEYLLGFEGEQQSVFVSCSGGKYPYVRWSVVLRDWDGVKTKPVEFTQTCRKSEGASGV